MPRTLVSLILTLILIVVFALGSPYAALFLGWLNGTGQASGIEHDGSVTLISYGRDLPRPVWIFVPPGARIAQASHVSNETQQRDVGMLEFATDQSVPEVRSFYEERLSREGFTVVDEGTRPLDARTAEYLGVADNLVATRAGSGDRVNISIQTPEGVLQTRLVRLAWYKITPEGVSHAAPGAIP